MYNLKLTVSDIITTDGYIEIAQEFSDSLCHVKTDFFKIGKFNWRGKLHPETLKENVIISHSDYPITDDISIKFKKVFCVNNLSDNKNTFSLPLGIPNNDDELKILSVIGDKETLIDVRNENVEKEYLLYLNFSTTTYPKLRNKLFLKFKIHDWVRFGEMNFNMEGRIKYLTEIKKSKFVLCPRGNGIDTHRLWETLYLGSIPIIEKFRTHDICQDLPILFIDDWSEINKEFLNKKYEEISNQHFNLEKLKLSYWKSFIKEKIMNYV